MPRESQNKTLSPPSNLFEQALIELYRSVCLTIEVFLHRKFGSRYVGPGFMGVIIIWIFSAFLSNQHQNPIPLLAYAAVYCLVWLVVTVLTIVRSWRGRDKVHSKYTGLPHLWPLLLPSWKEENFKHLEAAAVILIGWGVRYLNPPLGDYLMFSGSLVLVRGYCLVMKQRERAMELNDMVIEEKQVAERFRELQRP